MTTEAATRLLAEALHDTPWSELGDLTWAHGGPTDRSWIGPAEAILAASPALAQALSTKPDSLDAAWADLRAYIVAELELIAEDAPDFEKGCAAAYNYVLSHFPTAALASEPKP